MAKRPTRPDRLTLSVSGLTGAIKEVLEGGFTDLWIEGELSNVRMQGSGHLYFTLRDSGAQLPAVMFRGYTQKLFFEPEDGMLVVAHGGLSVYEPHGRYQFSAISLRPLGAGALSAAFERLKGQLAAEGLFDVERKRPLPEFPERIGLVTSPTGAVLQDIRAVIGRRFPGVELLLVPVRVQGIGAADEIAAAIGRLNRLPVPPDLLIVARGGGSIEDLWPFNEEVVVRALAGSRIPTVSAVGHETDVTLADLAADVRAATPSHAAELVVRDRIELTDYVHGLRDALTDALRDRIRDGRERVASLTQSRAFAQPKLSLDSTRQTAQTLADRLTRAHQVAHDRQRSALGSLVARLDTLNPDAVLRRGYALVRTERGTTLRRASLARPGDRLRLTLSDGTVPVIVTDPNE